MRRSLHSLSIPLAAATTFVAVYVMTPAQSSAPDNPADITYPNCTAARAAGAAPMDRGEPGYRAELDRDGDGTACEPYRR